jgi:hypothetical protein
MKLYLKAYLNYLRAAAIGIPTAPFNSFLWAGVGAALREIGETLIGLVGCLVIIVTYPVSVFVVAAIACERDRRSEKRHAEWLRKMSRGDCIDWTE